MRRLYSCRGRLAYTHVDDSPRCKTPRLDAEWLEYQVWQRVESIINDPNKLQVLLQDTIIQFKEKKGGINNYRSNQLEINYHNLPKRNLDWLMTGYQQI